MSLMSLRTGASLSSLLFSSPASAAASYSLRCSFPPSLPLGRLSSRLHRPTATRLAPVNRTPCKFYSKGLDSDSNSAPPSPTAAPPSKTSPPPPSPSSLSPFQIPDTSTSTMATPAAIEQLSSQVQGLSLDSVTQAYPNAHPSINPLDMWRAHISNVLSKISGVDTSIIFPVIAWTMSLDKGDFTIPVPALRIKGSKPDALAEDWASKVCVLRLTNDHVIVAKILLADTWTSSGPRMILSLRDPYPTRPSCRSSSKVHRPLRPLLRWSVTRALSMVWI